MSSLLRVRVGGVPEHFNIPWKIALENKWFEEKGLDVEFIEYPGGTGAMRSALRSDQLDLAVALTEGLVADIVSHGPDVRIVGTYVESPLNWAASVAPDSDLKDISQMRGRRFGISNTGSGSHIMATVLADQQGWYRDGGEPDVRFSEPVGRFDALREGVRSGRFDVFLWERFMSQPFAAKGEVRLAGTVSAPWPSFLIAARAAFAAAHPAPLRRLLHVIARAARAFASAADSPARISASFGLSAADAARWLQLTQYAADTTAVSAQALRDTCAALERARVVAAGTAPAPEQLVDLQVAHLV